MELPCKISQHSYLEACDDGAWLCDGLCPQEDFCLDLDMDLNPDPDPDPDL